MKAGLRSALAAMVMACVAHPKLAVAGSSAFARACLAHAPEAAARSGLRINVITRVMLAESRGRPNAVSPKGAIGCMQIMPATWVYLSQRYGLGADPFDARMNMIGGALYLAELTRRFGLPGAYAAYNAGPARYVRFAANGTPLPAETVAYATRLGGAVAPAIDERPPVRWQEAGLFLARAAAEPDARAGHAVPARAGPEPATSRRDSVEEPRPVRKVATLFPLSSAVAPDW